MEPVLNTLKDAIEYFSDPVNCREYVVARRWPDGVVCPRCGSKSVTFLEKYNRWQCSARHDSRQFTAKTGTIFEDSPLGLDKWLMAMWQVVNCKNGVSSYEVHRAIGVTQKTAWFMDHRIRHALSMGTIDKLSGKIEADETFIGGKARNMHKDVRARKITGTGGRDATFGSDAVRRLDSLREPIFTEYGITVYGKLFQLKDKSVQEDSNGKFWGELQRDNGERWRVQFERRKLKEITSLFTKQVMVTGDVSYFQTRTPKLAANSVEADEERDMVFAFDELFGIHKLSYDADLQTLLGRRYGDLAFRKVLTVSKADILKREADEKKERAKKKARDGVSRG